MKRKKNISWSFKILCTTHETKGRQYFGKVIDPLLLRGSLSSSIGWHHHHGEQHLGVSALFLVVRPPESTVKMDTNVWELSSAVSFCSACIPSFLSDSF